MAHPGEIDKPDTSNSILSYAFLQSPLPMAIFEGPDYLCTNFNLAFTNISKHHDAREIPIKELLPELANDCERITNTVFKQGKQAYYYEFTQTQSYGNANIAWFDFVFSPLRDTANVVTSMLLTGFNVTQRTMALQTITEQEMLLKSMVNTAATALWMINDKGDITYVSKTWLNWTGRPFEAHLGRGWLQSVVEEDRERVFHRFAKRFAAEKVYNIDFQIVGANGESHWIATTGNPRYFPNGTFAGYVGSCTDITNRKETENLLIESESRFRRIADLAPIFIWMTDAQKHSTFFNKSWVDFTGKSYEELKSTLEPKDIHPDEQDKVKQSYTDAFEHRYEFYMEFRLKGHDDVYRWIGMKTIPRYTAEGEFEGFIGCGMDITENKEHEQVKNEFIGMASHELKTPITSIKAYVQLLMGMYMDDEDEFLKKSLTTVNKQINKLTRLITDLLDVSKIESGRLSLNTEHFLLNDLIKECIDEVQHTSNTHDIVFNQDGDLFVDADRDRIAQVITNLLTNGIKYSPESDHIDVYMDKTDDRVVVRVKDHGIGISPKEQQKVFNRFYRVEGRNEQTFSGFGIGLYVAAEIIRRHGGQIWVESEKRKGSVFSFALASSN